jgi:hypothetical protein
MITNNIVILIYYNHIFYIYIRINQKIVESYYQENSLLIRIEVFRH